MSDPIQVPEASLAGDILDFWFGRDPAQPLANSPRWFQRSDAFDDEVRRRFAAVLERAARGELDGWLATPRSALALVLVLDQFPRNLHRDSPKAFAQDATALQCTETALAHGLDASLPPVQRWFLLMPLMHAESLEAQEQCVARLGALAAATSGEVGQALAGALDYARRHRDAIARFGRFPHRNTLLGRCSSPAELEWLEAHPDGF